MDFIQAILAIVNTIFAIFGVLVAVETIKIRTKENKSSGGIQDISIEKEASFDSFKEPFGKHFYEKEFGESILKSIYEFQNNHSYTESEYVTNYRNNYWLKCSRFTRNIYADYPVKYMLFFFIPLGICLVLISLSFQTPFLLALSLVFSFFLLLTPFGIYRDKESNSGAVIYSGFNLGKVKYVSAYFKENEDNSICLNLFIRVPVLLFDISIYRRKKFENLDYAVKEFILVKNFCSPVAKGYDITFTTPSKTESNIYTYIIEIYYGWIRLVWFIGEKIRYWRKKLF